MAPRRDAAIEAKLRKTRCPGGNGHSQAREGTARPQSQCALCRSTAYLTAVSVPKAEPKIEASATPEGKKKRFGGF